MFMALITLLLFVIGGAVVIGILIGVTLCARVRANKGASYLDDKIPDWRERENPVILDMSYSNTCVLGQLNRTYHVAFHKLGLDAETSISLGFRARADGSRTWFVFTWLEYKALTRAWRQILKAEAA